MRHNAADRLKRMPFEALGYATVDHHRSIRRGIPEVIFGEGKTVEQVVETVRGNVEKAQRVLRTAVQRIGALPPSPTFAALESAIMTSPDALSADARERLALFLEDREFHSRRSP